MPELEAKGVEGFHLTDDSIRLLPENRRAL